MKISSRAFTLIELLVVIAVVALLISILLPAIARARESARTVVCLSNQRQMGAATSVYQNENKTYYPGDHWEAGASYSIVSWMPRIRKVMERNTQIFYCPTYPTDYKWTPFDPSSSWGAAGRSRNALGVHVGYEEQEALVTGKGDGRALLDLMCYGYNGWGVEEFSTPQHLGLGGHIQQPKEAKTGVATGDEVYFIEIPEHKVIYPSDMIVLTDSDGNGQWDTTSSSSIKSQYPGRIHGGGSRLAQAAGAKGAAERQSGKTNIIFADGHATTMNYDDVIAEGNNRTEIMMQRWNNDHKPHKEYW